MDYEIYSIYFDMLNVPFNIDIKKILEDCVVKNIRDKPIYLIRIINHKDMLLRLCDHILCEDKINYRATTFPGAVWDHLKQVNEAVESYINIWGKWSGIIDKNYIPISNLVFKLPKRRIIK